MRDLCNRRFHRKLYEELRPFDKQITAVTPKAAVSRKTYLLLAQAIECWAPWIKEPPGGTEDTGRLRAPLRSSARAWRQEASPCTCVCSLRPSPSSTDGQHLEPSQWEDSLQLSDPRHRRRCTLQRTLRRCLPTSLLDLSCSSRELKRK